MSSPGAGGHWSDGETWALIEAWGSMYLARPQGRLYPPRRVAPGVRRRQRPPCRRFNRSIVQCQYRLYALKSQYKKELAKGQPTSGWRHFAQLRAFLADPDNGPPPGFAAKMPSASVKEEEVVVEEELEEKEGAEEASESAGRKTVTAKRHFSSLRDILDRSGGPPPGFPPSMPATSKKEKVKEEVDTEGQASAGCCPAAVVTKLAEVYWSVEMERLSMEKEKMAMEREKRAAKVEAENLGETHDN